MKDKKKLVLVGAGHAHIQLLRHLEKTKPLWTPHWSVFLVNSMDHSIYSGALPGVLAGLLPPSQMQIPLEPLCQKAQVHFLKTQVQSLLLEKNSLQLYQGNQIHFDQLSLNVGSLNSPLPHDETVPVISLKPIGDLLSKWQKLLDILEQWEHSRPPHVALIGGGATGAEIAMALAAALTTQQKLQKKRLAKAWNEQPLAASSVAPVITLWQREDLLPNLNPRARKKLIQALHRWQIQIQTYSHVTGVFKGQIHYEIQPRLPSNNILSFETSKKSPAGPGDSRTQPVDFVLLATPAAPNPLIKNSSLPLIPPGFIGVEPTLQVSQYPHIWAAGDCVAFPAVPFESPFYDSTSYANANLYGTKVNSRTSKSEVPFLPKSGVYAVRQGALLSHNLCQLLSNNPNTLGTITFKNYVPQTRTLALIATADHRAIGAWGPFAMDGTWLWRWKQYLDQSFVQP
ncbi:MAG: FAD-dependent oxidoreductase [Bdellovibrionales bacterium]|nr:FAD-dependent oxidoreductase [Bdellovibrionales bacterium]